MKWSREEENKLRRKKKLGGRMGEGETYGRSGITKRARCGEEEDGEEEGGGGGKG